MSRIRLFCIEHIFEHLTFFSNIRHIQRKQKLHFRLLPFSHLRFYLVPRVICCCRLHKRRPKLLPKPFTANVRIVYLLSDYFQLRLIRNCSLNAELLVFMRFRWIWIEPADWCFQFIDCSERIRSEYKANWLIAAVLKRCTKILNQSEARYAEKRIKRSKKSDEYTRVYHNFFTTLCPSYVIHAHTFAYAIIFCGADAFPCVALHELRVFIVFKVIRNGSVCVRYFSLIVFTAEQYHMCVQQSVKRFSEWISFKIVTGTFAFDAWKNLWGQFYFLVGNRIIVCWLASNVLIAKFAPIHRQKRHVGWMDGRKCYGYLSRNSLMCFSIWLRCSLKHTE